MSNFSGMVSRAIGIPLQRQNSDGTIDLICPRYYRTAVKSGKTEELEERTIEHWFEPTLDAGGGPYEGPYDAGMNGSRN
jgi:hypothetical protein